MNEEEVRLRMPDGLAAAPPPPADPAAAVPDRRRWLVLAVVGVAQLMVVLDATIVNIALPSAQRAPGFGTTDRQWVITAYALAFGGLLLLTTTFTDPRERGKALGIFTAIAGGEGGEVAEAGNVRQGWSASPNHGHRSRSAVCSVMS
jgi:MFS family permease